ncbi:hypothetical protein HS088_TW20G00407 [Tripterygium wilfordii]|uniref:WRKY domain-containing protein n=1 Tax=Tripterygium wilfordii TaxID=458696 RepID=A0A7J7C877_TRIWF|nr:WRKY transcription factor 22-like [Tripterygium wilfordii]KAF5730037.1 hypothetical protein HS088_TW20G00407 [Tripterygium wilfordii]
MMSEFVYMEEDWDLQAVVRGWTANTEDSANFMDNSPSYFTSSSIQQHDYFPSSFKENFEIDAVSDQLYEPFFPVLQPLATTSISVPCKEAKEPQKQISPKLITNESSKPTTSVAKSRSRKNLHKKVVQQAAEGGSQSDMWAWRKYGQKPIKGSPYPRSYYRCSSLKGCLARKQVERSGSDPTQYIITYTAEHSHTHPTRRRSLPGSTRTNKSSQHKETNMPTTTSTEDVIPKLEEGQTLIMEDRGSHEIMKLQDMLFNDDLFPSIEDFEGFFPDQYADSFDLLTNLEQ